MDDLRPCPDARRLELMVQAQLAELEVQKLSEHVLECSACADRLDRLLANDAFLPIVQGLEPEELPENSFVEELVERLVQVRPDPHLFTGLNSGGDAPTVPNSHALPSATRIPGFEILGELGRGGMGVVYKARHLRLNRLVALKMMRAGGDGGAESLARFQAEAEAVAHLFHPHIVQIHEIGQQGDFPWFAMEYVDGGSLQARVDSRPLEPRAAAEILEKLARAMHYAHENGIVHRDLKPGNILLSVVRTEPHGPALRTTDNRQLTIIPKIADFGLAKRLKSGSDLTRTGQLLGTPSYMAPEQAQGKSGPVGPAVDLYGLGAILYAMLTGRPPFLADTPYNTVLQVIGQDPVPPRRWQPGISPDLETICLKCLAKEPARRYSTAQELAEDVHRYLDGDPILARPLGALARLSRWCRRHRVAAALFAAAGLFVAVLAVSTIWVWRNEQHVVAAYEAKVAEHRAARRAVDDMYTQVAEQWLANEPQMEGLQREFLLKALAYYTEFSHQESRDAQDRLDVSRAYRRVGDIQRILWKYSEAKMAYEEARRLFQELADAFPESPVYRLELAETYMYLAFVLQDSGQLQAAEQAHQHGLDLIRALVDRSPENPEYHHQLARHYINQGTVYDYLHRDRDAEQAYLQGHREFQRLTGAFPEDARFREGMAVASYSIGAVLVRSGAKAEAESRLKEAQGLWTELLEAEPGKARYRHSLGKNCYSLARLLDETGRGEAALPIYKQGLVLEEKLASDFPRVPRYQEMAAGLHSGIGYVHVGSGRPVEAEAALRRSLAVWENSSALFSGRQAHLHWNLGEAQANLGKLLFSSGKQGEASELLRRSIENWETAVREDPESIGVRIDLAGLLATSPESALRRPERAAALAQEVVAKAPADSRAWSILGIARYRAGDWAGSIQALDRADELTGKEETALGLWQAMALWRLGECTRAQERYDETDRKLGPLSASSEEIRLLRAEAASVLAVRQ